MRDHEETVSCGTLSCTSMQKGNLDPPFKESYFILNIMVTSVGLGTHRQPTLEWVSDFLLTSVRRIFIGLV